MKNKSELTDFYYKKLFGTLQKLEIDRKQLRSRIITIGFFYTFIAVVLFFTLLDKFFNVEMLVFLGFGYFSLGALVYKFLVKDYTHEFKHSIIRPLIHALDKNLKYTPSLHVPQRYFTRSKIFTQAPDKLSGNDYVKGTIDGIPIQFSDIHAQKRHRDSKGRTSYKTMFQGLFVVSEFNKHFHGSTVILPDVAVSTFGDFIGGFLQSKNLSRDQLVKMDSPAFEKEFVVYSSDQVEARYILSHTLMQQLLNYKKRSKHPLFISFTSKNIHLAIEYNKDLFEPSVFHSLLKYKVAMEYIATLHLAIGIVQELKLNQKLWSKQ
ncbi:DUF3137 domain-containing protein [Sulfurimonas sp.]|jgi:hypothetical protein|uniref:DUF3137 domain-containing protein n=1 Tax=Sulfurimonas sp. TaxID=2022749 RepID=UPI0025CD1A37|nr:DUF3137 domain-containing protein [Sulfurimonas sp.]MBT5935631.1 DUF3137 domain-containing protein [Sulfurimonas sp.]